MGKASLIIVTLSIIVLFGGFYSSNMSAECDIKKIYEETIPEDYDTKVLTRNGEIEEVESILIPTNIKTGDYKISLSRKASNLYKVVGTKYYIETRFCYEYATYGDAILSIESSYGYTVGRIYFK